MEEEVEVEKAGWGGVEEGCLGLGAIERHLQLLRPVVLDNRVYGRSALVVPPRDC